MRIWDRFDRIVCLHYLPYKNERFKNIATELKRVGILDNPRFEWGFTTPVKFYDYIRFPKGTVRRGSGGVTPGNLSQTINTFIVLKRMQMKGCDSILLLEDDIVFHKDLDFMKSVLDKTPEDADVANYDPFRRKGWNGAGKGYWGHYYDLKGNEVKKDWDGDTFMRYSSVVYHTSCVMMSKRGLDHWIEEQEKELCPIDWPTWRHAQDLNTYCVTTGNNLCIQNKKYNDKICQGYGSTYDQIYGKNFDITQYNLT